MQLWIEASARVSSPTAGEDQPELPAAVALDQNFPNPFNPATPIGFTLPASGHVRLVVYDLLGREVATLPYENRAAGVHHVRFDAGSLPSGVYLYRIQTDQATISRTITLIK